MPIAVKRVYEKASRADGKRVLIDRLWPCGLSKKGSKIHLWLRELAPSDGLRQWFHAHPEGWLQFRRRYLKELMRPETNDTDALRAKFPSKRAGQPLYRCASDAKAARERNSHPRR